MILDGPVASGAVLRPTVRVLLLDDADRLLLFRFDALDGPIWCTAGGGIDPGESAERAALRELAEETGRAGVELGQEVWHRRVVLPTPDGLLDLRERWFLCRVPAFAVDTAGFTPEERRMVGAHRWWTAAELAVSTERFAPRDLAHLLAGLLRDGPPPVPVEVGS